MGWLGRLFGRGPDEPQPERSDAEIEAAADAAFARLERLALPAIELELRAGEPVPEAATSSIGGRPSLPPGAEWPTDRTGQPMLFLAQLRFDELPPLDGFPARGLLSFFVEDTEEMGLDGSPDAYRVLWSEEPDGLIRAPLPQNAAGRARPFGPALSMQGAPLAGRRARGLPPTTGDEFEAALAAETGGWPDGSSGGASDGLFVRLTEDEALTHFVGGYPETTQRNPRPSDVDAGEVRVLLQLGWSGLDADRDWEVCFGDAGQAVFLATRQEMEERRFGEAIFYWDCA